MAIDLTSIILLATFFIVYGIFLCYDFFRKGERWGFIAYIVAVIPANLLWYYALDILLVYTVLFVLWIIALLRDLLLVYRKTKEYDDILLFLGLGIIVQLILTGILPADQLNSHMQANNVKLGFFYFPDVYTASNDIQSWVNSTYLLAF
ncbi:MAG: hypothetical protein GF383_09145, partial [Candidatus Lokiarchaeota archaeon]|nr:hypothetical protein [Candidatus Lokiarchaeota archaeon]MBD3340657.1 hypothetical protein [Candidatus Lokiarchaeota archaeon]